MRHFLGFAFLFVTFGLKAQVVNTYAGLCQFSVHSDSFGHGIASALTGHDLRGRYNDENCYHLGFESAQEAIRIHGRSNCKQNFDQGYPEGLKASARSGVLCFNLGVSAGLAALGSGAREQKVEVVGRKCISAYNEGKADGLADRSSQFDSSDAKLLYCYRLGHFEAKGFNQGE